MTTPTVSFVIPCYRLAHLLSECVNSILLQTYRDFEVLIMDDCSPDNTAEVATSFDDPRVRYIRNEQNLGHLRNYNKGIGLSRGKYVWLISADDYLRRPYILRRYVELMNKYPQIGYTFCPGVAVRNGLETAVLDYSVYGKHDRIVNGHVFLKKLLICNMVVAASAMARRECYEKISIFPLDAMWAGAQVDMGWLGDWYLWCMFALFSDVGYFAEPMVCYREHDLSMTNVVTRQENIENCSAAEIGMLWIIRQKAKECGLRKLSNDCLLAVANEYVRHVTSKQYRQSTSLMSIDQFEDSLCRSTESEKEKNWVRARLFEGIGDRLCLRGDGSSARQFYRVGLQKDPRMVKVYAKLFLLWLGKPGDYVRKLLRSFRGIAATSLPEDS
jgi:glycosyltransferase involved in cell wall biosynthesis